MAKDKIMKRVKTEEVDKFDIVFNHFISEGYSEKEAYAEMVNLTEEELDEMLGAITRATKSLATRAAEYGANIGKKGSTTGFLNRNPNKMARKKCMDMVGYNTMKSSTDK